MSEPFVGEIRMFAGNFAPRGWAFCDGQLLAVSQNDALFSLLGTVYGGDGRTTFGLPDMRGRIPVHPGTGPGLSPRQLGQKSGSEQVTLTPTQLPSHTHPLQASLDGATEINPQAKVTAQAPTGDIYGNIDTLTNLNTQAVTEAGGNQPHYNLMPFLCIHFIIALFGIYPSRT
ncbi:MAG: phage tail protein [Candidatus Omnitrophica bacterium]|nr:phage tail protein [Candidatus Omnitrophota bacterium]